VFLAAGTDFGHCIAPFDGQQARQDIGANVQIVV
tara:strand:+ start:23710 stop:23811 length:102 start_codon:yes stop_codon:yes gene_type:complete